MILLSFFCVAGPNWQPSLSQWWRKQDWIDASSKRYFESYQSYWRWILTIYQILKDTNTSYIPCKNTAYTVDDLKGKTFEAETSDGFHNFEVKYSS